MVRALVVVRGIVQGVGFRPFVYRLAQEHQLKGWVLNSTEGVVIEVEGEEGMIQRFITHLTIQPPPLAVIERVETSLLPPVGYNSFIIEPSQETQGEFVLISPDIAICPDCLAELFHPSDRRYLYPFINCTNCGPRFTIIQDIPYDRPKTTMKVFPMCPQCQEEYHNPADRRFHAQPNACPTCGPRVELVDRQGSEVVGEPITTARRLLSRGAIVAVKGLGGFHLACDATNSSAVATLRERKHRVDKPFAIMSLDAETVANYCFLSPGERQLLESPARPIVLLRRRPGSPISELVAPHNNYLGVMLPYTPLHYLLLQKGADTPLALVMTSGNMSEEPLAIDNQEALERLSPLADYFLLHNRDIHVRCDDSVTRLFEGKEMVIRRSRGYAPFPVRLHFEVAEILACGPELKNTFCLTKGDYAFLSQHIGDMENYETLTSYQSSIEHLKGLFRVNPRAVAYDLHPQYLATIYALEVAQSQGLEAVAVQHHHAHIASCLAENGLQERVIGVAFDGTGYGTDGRIWGGEFLACDFQDFQRVGHFQYVPLPGGEAAIRRPYRMALSHLQNAFGQDLPRDLDLFSAVDPTEEAVVMRLAASGVNSPLTSSCGRLFDAVSALLGVRRVVNYEGQAAMELEMAAVPGVEEGYPWGYLGEAPLVIDPAPIIRAVVADLRGGVDKGVISARFHNTIADIILTTAIRIRKQTGLNRVALSGGVFQNIYLLSRALGLLRGQGFEVFTHHQVPANDGGIALGQAVVAHARLRAKKEVLSHVSRHSR